MTCQTGGSKGKRAGMMMGEKSGNNEPKTASEPFGLLNTDGIIMKAMITGTMMGSMSCCPSPMSSPMAEPTAANNEEYKK